MTPRAQGNLEQERAEPADPTAEQLFAQGRAGGRFGEPNEDVAEGERLNLLARKVVETLVARHYAVAVFVTGTAEVFSFARSGFVDLATGRFQNMRQALPRRMRQSDWAEGVVEACRLGWIDGIYRTPGARDGRVLAAVSAQGLAACLLTGDRYQADADTIHRLGPAWYALTRALGREMRALRDALPSGSTLWVEAGTEEYEYPKLIPGAPGAAEAILLRRIDLRSRMYEEMARLRVVNDDVLATGLRDLTEPRPVVEPGADAQRAKRTL